MEQLLEFLSRTDPFSQLKGEDQARIAQLARLRTYSAGEIAVLYGEEWNRLFVVLGGKLLALKESREGRRLTVLSLHRGEVFWGLAFFQPGAPMPVSIEAREESQLAIWRREDLVPLLTRNGAAVWALAEIMVARMQQASEIVEGLAFQPVAGRLASFLLEQYGPASGESQDRDFTLDEMAGHIGSTREVVCRLLSRFSDEQLITITRTEFALTDHDGLAVVASGN